MTELELEQKFCANCISPNCMRCPAFAAYYRSENGLDEYDPNADDYYEIEE